MELNSLIKKEYILLEPKSHCKLDILKEMCEFAGDCGIVSDVEEFYQLIINRETLGSTGIGKNIAIPHARSEHVQEISIIFTKHNEGVDFDSLDNKPAKLFFLLASPIDVESKYLQVLAHLSRLLRKEDIRDRILEAKTSTEILEILTMS